MGDSGRARFGIGTAILASLLIPQIATAQVHVEPPGVVRLSDVEIQLLTGGGDGCLNRCVVYRVTVRGTGTVELEDMGTAPRAATKRRTITDVEVVTLVNEFLKVRFFSGPDGFQAPFFYVQDGEFLSLHGTGGSGKYVDLTIKLGSLMKTVRLKESVPAEWERLRDIVWRMGGPDAWSSGN